MKKLLASFIALLLILCVAVPSSLADEDITLTIALIGDGQLKADIDRLLAEYTEETGVKVESIYIDGGWGVYCTKIQTMISGGEQLDLAIMAIEGIQLIVDMGLPMSFTGFIEQNPERSAAILDDIADDMKKTFIFDDEYYAFPFSFNNVVMHLNTDRFEAAGVELPAADWTTEDFLDICEKLTVEEDGMKKFAVCVPFNEYFCMEAWLLNNGASYLNETLDKATINSPEAVEVFQLWQDLIYKYGYAPIPEVNVNAIQQLIDGQVAMGSWGRWPTTSYMNSNFDDVSVQWLPNFSENTQIYGVDGFFVMNGTKHPDEAIDLACWLSEPGFAGQYLTYGNIPVLQSLAEEKISALGIPGNYKLFYDSSVPMRAVSAPANFAEVSSIVLRAMSEICVNQADVQSTLDAAAEEINATLSD